VVADGPVRRARLVAVARGDEPPDLVVSGAHVFCAFTKEWLDVDVAVADGRVAGLGDYDGPHRFDASGGWLVPGFIDAHVHVESSKLTPDEFARVVLRHGTTAVVCDPHEIANVLGVEGVSWLLDAGRDLPVEIFVMAPSSVPASAFESPRGPLSLADMERILEHPRALGVAEMMNFPGVVAGDEAELSKLALPGSDHADGHAPELRGRALDAYLAAGIRTDHEAVSYAEALEKRRKGMWVLIREASNARNLADLLPVVRDYGVEHCAFCTDDREPDMLVREGHLNQMCRAAVADGLAAEDALVLASLHSARCHGLRGHGGIAPGWLADFSLLPDLEGFRPDTVWSRGAVVVDGGEVLWTERRPVPEWVRASVRVAPVAAADLAIPFEGERVRAIGVVAGSLITRSEPREPRRSGGFALADPEHDLAKIAVVERHHATGRIGKGFVTGFGLRKGAFASTVAHDAHNIVVVGVADEDMAACVSRLAELGGGIVAARGGEIVEELPLPVAGLLSDRPAEEVVAALDSLHAALGAMGVTMEYPFMTLSFLALSVIPALKITDRGLVDVERFELVGLEAP
jgi:adenine deaminase